MSSDSPIVQVPEPEEYQQQDDLIYQQQQDDIEEFDDHHAIPQKLKLDLRGTRMELHRDTLINLPESLLIAMFPNGLVLSRPNDDEDDDDFDEDDYNSRHSVGVDEQLNYVDFDPVCLEYFLKFYKLAADVKEENKQDAELRRLVRASAASSPVYYTLLTKQPIIVLREELEYFVLPISKKKDVSGLKLKAGQYLKELDPIFDALQKNISRENNVAEQHLIDMLCDAGFQRQDKWGYREIEPTKAVIASMALVLLKTVGPDNHMATAQKLFLFWRKPAVS
jgi:hypothetical protein